ncbi:MAG: methenyltetrahydromethanopterin cyclohydrolase [Planctomycetes bacterium]|nr:methenyltetrahydromethanopterin cyclohydrolase [Planctomycetota bacterium]
MTEPRNLNEDALRIAEDVVGRHESLGIVVHQVDGGGRVIDAGINAPGGVEAGVELACLCLSGRGQVVAAPEAMSAWRTHRIDVQTDDPIAACLASQYAGWQISVGKYFAMGSGPMRAAYGGEELFEEIGMTESPCGIVGGLESDALPGNDVFAFISEKTGVPSSAIVLAVAPTNSLAGGLQVVARSVETALHKLHNLKFDLTRIVRGEGSAPLPPVADKSLDALGRTNDAMLYGADVTLQVTGDDATLKEIGPMVPASSSKDYGTPFGEIFKRYEYDFYKIDSHLFSPAKITLQNVDSGNAFTFGEINRVVLEKSFLS